MISEDQAVLKLDIDDGMEKLPLEIMKTRLWRAGYTLQWWTEEVSPGGKGCHIHLRVEPNPISAVEVVALQAILGSDPYREACNLHRAKLVDRKEDMPEWMKDRWNVLYRKPTRKQ